MSAFFRLARAYADDFEVSGLDRGALYGTYLASRLVMEASYQRGARGLVARQALKPLSRVRIEQRIHGTGGDAAFDVAWTASDLSSFQEIFFHRVYATPLRTATTYVDVGANTGMTAAFFASRYELEKVVLIEANPALIPRLEKLATSIDGDVVVTHAAVTTYDGEIEFSIDANHRHSLIGPGRRVPSRKLRSILEDNGILTVDLLKVDIEGAEHDVLASDPGILDRVQCLLIELHNDIAKREFTINLIRARGFDQVDLHRGEVVDFVVASRS